MHSILISYLLELMKAQKDISLSVYKQNTHWASPIVCVDEQISIVNFHSATVYQPF